jgi:calcineurin-like phosphoesterase family protein
MNTFFTSDTHFGHRSVIEFSNRPFTDVEEMDECLIENWNTVVKKDDRVYHLGDFAWTVKRAKEVRPRLNGNIRLIVGNHDDIPALAATGMFQRMQLWRAFPDWSLVATHIPLAFKEMRRGLLNIHGHKHDDMTNAEPHHVNVCVENTGYYPVHVDYLMEVTQEQRSVK